MDRFTFEDVTDPVPVPALQGSTTNALVHSPFVFEDVTDPVPVPALQGSTTNALVHSPFVFGDGSS